MIDEKHMTAMCHGQLFQHRAEQAFNKKGNLVLKKHDQAMPDHRGKSALTYEGPYMVKKVFL